jgi:hypothetical protein
MSEGTQTDLTVASPLTSQAFEEITKLKSQGGGAADDVR